MEPDVASTLTELERKLKELERELEAVGRNGEADTEPAQAGWTPPGEPAAAPVPDPGPPPPGATPFTAVWHGGEQAPPPPPPMPGAAPPAEPAADTPPPPAPHTPPPPAAHTPPPPAAAEPLDDQLDELTRFRERLVDAATRLVGELSGILEELGVEPPAPAAPADPVFTGRVVVEAAPFADLASLSAFEQALARTAGVAGASVRRLDAGRATIDVELERPTALTAELRATAAASFTVVEAGDEHLVLELVTE
jgi:hypothetical protein